MNWTTLVSAEEVFAQHDAKSLRAIDARFISALRLVDARFSLNEIDAGEKAWSEAHLPGAGYVHLDRDLSDHRKPATEGRHPLPEADAFCATLARLGITPESQVVVYDAADGAMAAARFWWLMKLLGHQRVAVLDGGFARWQQLGYPIESTKSVITRGHYQAQFNPAQIVQDEEVQQRLTDAPGWLLDARAPERFRGEVEPLDRVAGHIPGALNRPFAANVAKGQFRSADELRLEFKNLIGSRPASEVVLNCGSGVTACHNLLAMEYAGLSGPRIYAGSWSGWISDPTRPVAK